MNIEEFSKHKVWTKRHYAFFSALHRQIGGQTMTDFEWLREDKLVQRTKFGDSVEIFVSFGADVFVYKGIEIPARSVVARWRGTGEIEVFSVE